MIRSLNHSAVIIRDGEMMKKANTSPLSTLADVASSLASVVTPSQRGEPSITHVCSLLQHNFILQRPRDSGVWGVSIALFENKYLIVGGVNSNLVARYTVYAGTTAVGNQQQPLPPSSVALLRSGDLIRSINGRPIAAFHSFEDIVRCLQNSFCLSFVVLRDSNLPENLTKSQNFETTEQVYALLKPFLSQLTPLPHPRSISLDSTEIRKPIAFPRVLTFTFTNQLFKDEKGNALVYDDDLEYSPEEGTRASLFLPEIGSYKHWLEKRKTAWRKNYRVYLLEGESDDVEDDSPTEVSLDFWSGQGYSSFHDWLNNRTSCWKRSYSWNLRKRKAIEQLVDEVVHYPSSFEDAHLFGDWLRVRKNQWMVLRRKRYRMLEQKLKDTCESHDVVVHAANPEMGSKAVDNPESPPAVVRQTKGEMLLIDLMLEEQEKRRLARLKTFDFDFLFDAKLGAPDDVIAHCMHFLHPSEHGVLLCISSKSSAAFKQRDEMWRQLSPRTWVLPRRPRKPWYSLYITKMRQEAEASQKQSDDLLSKVASILFKGDHSTKVEKLVSDGERKFGFDVDYVSGIVCERNSMLNLAVINGRQKVVRWLIEKKGADIGKYQIPQTFCNVSCYLTRLVCSRISR
jgi:hypothetical protein